MIITTIIIIINSIPQHAPVVARIRGLPGKDVIVMEKSYLCLFVFYFLPLDSWETDSQGDNLKLGLS